MTPLKEKARRYSLVGLGVAIIAFLIVAFVAIEPLTARGSADLKVDRVIPAEGRPYAAAISADGRQVAMMHRQYGPMMEVTTDIIEVRDVQSGREVRTITLPTIHWAGVNRQYYLSRDLSYCDGGKYLLASTGPGTLVALDTRNFRVHASFDLIGLSMPLRGERTNRPFSEMNFASDVQADCSAKSGVAALAFWGDRILSMKLLNLDAGKVMTGVEYDFRGRYLGDGMALSPDGSKVALASWNLGSKQGSQIELVDVRTGSHLSTLPLNDGFRVQHRLAFIGEGNLLIGQPLCQPNQPCDLNALPHGRTLRVWDIEAKSRVRTLGWPEAETYRSFGASANGDVAFAYTGTESYCESCNSGIGELRIEDARFAVWNPRSGQIVLRSPKLRIETHTCPTFSIGACESYEQVPELQMSASGNAILAFWPVGGDPPPDKGVEMGELEVFQIP